MNRISRRHLLQIFGATSGLSPWLGSAQSLADEITANRTVGIIGHTGRGNYGHGLDTVWLSVPGARIVGVADVNPAGLAKKLPLLGVDPSAGYTNYQQMLAEKRPDYVSVCPRYVDQHAEMVLAAIEAGVKGVYVEKPYCSSPAQADRILLAAKKHQTKIAVAHRNRWHPVLPKLRQLIDEGLIGNLLEIRGRGKGDRRGGVEDLWVLGSHVLNLVHYFAGDPLNCTAVVLHDGRRVTSEDVYAGNEGIGPAAGNELHARYKMSNGVVAYFDSIANDGSGGHGFGLQLIGTQGIINMRCDRDPLVHLIPGNPFLPDEKKPRPWIPVSSAGVGQPEPKPELLDKVHHHVVPVEDLVAVSESQNQDLQPLCDARAAGWTVEMICGVFASHCQNSAAVKFPLPERENAFDLWTNPQKSAG